MTLLDELLRDRVRTSIGTTLSRTVERTAEKFASEWMMDPAMRQRLKALVDHHCEAAVADLLRERPARRRKTARKKTPPPAVNGRAGKKAR
jgi:hypothetical protein